MSNAISRRDFLKVTGAVGAAGLLAACGGGSSSSTAAANSAPASVAAPTGDLQKKLAQKVIHDGLSVRQTETLAKRLAARQEEAEEELQPSGEPDYAIYLRAAEQDLTSRFGRKVTIVSGKKKGKIELEYYNTEDLNLLLETLERLPSGEKGAKP